jgi:beta-galactosidase
MSVIFFEVHFTDMIKLMHRFYLVAVILSLVFTANAFAGVPVREDTLLDSDWHFQSGDVSGAGQSGFDDSHWQKISVPHNWGWAEAHAGNKNYYRGPGWYRRELDVTPSPDKCYFLRFEAASTVAEVYVNGNFLGEHRGGFGAFAFEITTNLAAGGTNQIAVRVNNASQPDIAPVEGDFNVYGGLYRPVHLIVTGAEHLAVTDHGSSGVAWSQTSVSETQAVIDVTAQVANGTNKRQKVIVVTKILDAGGNEIASTNQTISLSRDWTEPAYSRIIVTNPHLWNGRKDPYLYHAVVELDSGTNVVDSIEQPLGLRWYSIDPDKGFFLNGKKYPIYGVCRHQDRPVEGWAITQADMEQDISLMKEMGVTAVRCAHYEHSDYFYSLCDQAGILAWAEIPQVNIIHAGTAFENTSRNQLLDLIRQNVNHPSIFVWSLFNEVGGPVTDDPHRELQDLSNVAHGEDPTRPTIGAASHTELIQLAKIPDLTGWNTYPGWYGGKATAEAVGNWLDRMRYASRHGGFCVSEYGAGANITQHEENPKQPNPSGAWHPEEYQNVVHEADWAAIKSHPFVWGSFLWNMFEFCVATRHEGGQEALNDKGLVTYDRTVKKDAFYFYKANWSDEPVLYLTSRRFTERTNAVTDVKIYSNANEAELLVNGTSLGKKSNDGNAVFIWKNVPLTPGENKIEAKAERNGQELTDRCVWMLAQ